MPSRAARYLLASPLSRADKMAYDTRAEDYMTDRVNNASYFSSYALEEGYDTAKKSRNRDAQLLRDATDAIVHSESFATPQASVAARRVARGQSVVPLRATSAPPRPIYPEVDLWESPRSYVPLYTADTTTTADDYYSDLSYPRRPLIFYPNPWLYSAPRRVLAAQRASERAVSVPPMLLYREEQRRKVAESVPVFDDWRRAARARSVPFDVMPYTRPSYLPYYYGRGYGGYTPYYRKRLGLYLPPPTPTSPYFWPLPTAGLRAHRSPRHYLSRAELRAGLPSALSFYDYDPYYYRRRPVEDEEAVRYGTRHRVLASPLARASLARTWRHVLYPFALPKAKKAAASESYSVPLLYAPRKGSKGKKAALIASRMEVDSLPRRPRSEYAARKYRAMRRADQESIYTKGPRTSAYYASSPPLPKLTERKAIRTEEGYSKPKNLLSWQYRLDAIMRPSDLLYQPTSSFGRIRRQVRAAQEGMDRHRQLLDRYLPEEGAESTDAAARVLRKMAEMERRDPVTDVGAAERQRSTVKIPSYYACGVDPANPPKSDLRRRIQRTLNKTRRS
ncbi:uncharacterized protein LOC143286029 isoform X3 [Babylonia areolata]